MRLEDRDDLLRDKFWRSLRSEKLKLAMMLHFNTCRTFDLLGQKVRAEEYEMKLDSAMQQQAIRTERTGNSDLSDTKADMILERIVQLEKKSTKDNGENGRIKDKIRIMKEIKTIIMELARIRDRINGNNNSNNNSNSQIEQKNQKVNNRSKV